jgi:hypothetical protein
MNQDDLIKEKLQSILSQGTRIEHKDAELYLLNKKQLDEVLLLELSVRGNEKDHDKKNPFFSFGKIINPKKPAFKYTLYLAHKFREVFDHEKALKAIPGEFIVWKRTLLKEFQKKLNDPDIKISSEEVEKQKRELEDRISIEEQNVERIIANANDYEIVITNYEQERYYSSIYYALFDPLDPNKREYKDTHLRKDVPNFLWFEDIPFAKLRGNDKITKIIKTYTRVAGVIYIKEKNKPSNV